MNLQATRTVRGVAVTTVCAFGSLSSAIGPSPVAFESVALPTTDGRQYTSVAIGPDDRLYATALDGAILRWARTADGTTGAAEVITSLTTAEGGDRLLIGMAFDPASTAASPILWVSHTTYGFQSIPDWGGKISRLSGADLETVEAYVVGLPRSAKDHVSNGLAFGPDGALYLVQGSNSAMGAADAIWENRPERLLTAAVLRLDVDAVTAPPIDVRTDGTGSYDPYAPGAPLTLFGTGTRNPYDLLWHRNGQLYVPTNGSAPGGNTPAGTTGAPCTGGGVYTGPEVDGLIAVGLQSDYLFRVEAGGYYGHPNPLRCEFVMNGGNPTGAADPAEVDEYPVGTEPDTNYRGFAFDFGVHRSPNGVIEFMGRQFECALEGRMLVVRYSQGDDIIVLETGPEHDIVSAETGIAGFGGFNNPLDLTHDPATGYVYVSEFGGQRLTLLRPVGISTCPWDLDDDGTVGFADVLNLIGAWGPCPASTCCAADFNVSIEVDFADLLTLLGAWGTCR